MYTQGMLTSKCERYIFCFVLIDFKKPPLNQGLDICLTFDLDANLIGACLSIIHLILSITFSALLFRFELG